MIQLNVVDNNVFTLTRRLADDATCRQVQLIVSNEGKEKKKKNVSASHQTGLDTRSITRRLTFSEGYGREGRERVKARTLVDFAGHRLT